MNVKFVDVVLRSGPSQTSHSSLYGLIRKLCDYLWPGDSVRDRANNIFVPTHDLTQPAGHSQDHLNTAPLISPLVARCINALHVGMHLGFIFSFIAFAELQPEANTLLALTRTSDPVLHSKCLRLRIVLRHCRALTSLIAGPCSIRWRAGSMHSKP